MALKRIRIDPEKLGISRDPEGDRRRLIEEARYSSKVDRVLEDRSSMGSGALHIREKLDQRGLFLSLNDLMDTPMTRGPALDRHDAFQGMDDGYSGMLTEEFPTAHDDHIMEENHQRYYGPRTVPQKPARTPQQARALPQPEQRRSQPLREQIMGGTRPSPTASAGSSVPPWQVKAYLGETRGGGQVPIWKVCNGRTGTTIDKMFRIESVAARIVAVLNESGDINDPRALSLMHNYEKRDQLLKEARVLERDAAGKPMKTERLKAVRAQITQLDYRLGI